MQVVHIGRNSTRRLAEELGKHQIKHPMLVTGHDSFADCGAAGILQSVLSDCTPVPFADFTPNPMFDDAVCGAGVFREEQCDGIIAIGGGSAMDVGKSINAFQAHPGREADVATGKAHISESLVPLIAIPTTAGTGSEATQFAAIYIDGKKYSLDSAALLPDVAILDSRHTDSLPADITASTGFDALCHSIESYWAKMATEESCQYASIAIPLLIANVSKAVNDPDPDCRDKMLLAAHYGGKAINISRTTAPHALSYVITSEFNVPHGHAVALTLGKFFEINEIQAKKQRQKKLISLMQELYRLLGASSASEAEKQWYKLMKECGLEFSLTKLDISEKQHIDLIVDSVNLQRLANHPLTLETFDLRQTLKISKASN